ncbi:MAG TPA: 23S rRNA (pseudouridine(1915)-N(3))-methyltransferase RlmH [Stellaceae bacterium]|nr:23S rRNA (pseudouridine(1915)-N(3))-methyltransferase RlmH [Stellaceae bacterium]
MRIVVLAVGRAKAGPMKALERHYAERIQWPLAIREVEERRKLPPAELKEREGALLLAAIPRDAVAVALDAKGASLSSEAFAQRLARWRDGGAADVAFLIGGADGLSDAVRRQAALVLSLGAMTWPHLLARGMLLEQLYRAQQILAGHPYHRG